MTINYDKLLFLRTKFGKKTSHIPKTSTILFIGIIIAFGLIDFLMLYSASNGNLEPWAIKQLYVFCVMMVGMLIIQTIDLRLIHALSYKFYLLCLILLIWAELAGYSAMGAQRWLKIGGITIQPSELAKLGVILALARYFHASFYMETRKIQYLILPTLILIAPILLIFKQPNLGTAIIITMIGASIFFASGVRQWLFITPIVAIVAAAPFIWHLLLHDYQKQRILTFLHPENDVLGAGYNIAQSKIAIGSGGIFGKGFMYGSQGQLNFLPEKHTDFIFPMIAEEWGFIGAITIIIMYFIMLAISYRVALNTTNQFGRLVTMGVSTMIFIHVFINIAMISGLLPVVGIPLPLLSYGGSNLAAIMMGLGLVLNVNMHKKEALSRRF